MGISELEPKDAPPKVVGCPMCGQADRVNRVPAVVDAGWRLPAAAPTVKYDWSPVMVAVAASGIVLWSMGLVHGWNGTYAFRVALFTALLVRSVRLVVPVFKRRKRIRLGEPAALAVWNEGWLCARCDVTYFQPGYEPPGVGLHQALSYEEFRYEVYRAGGYQDLAEEKQP